MNYKHLYYFWTVAKAGSIARASEQLHLTPQTISGQLSLFENVLGETLFDRSRRRFALTDAGRTVLGYAEEIFSLGKEMEEVLRHRPGGRPLQFRVGVSDAVPKALAYKLIEPALRATENSRIVCREGKVAGLMAELAIHQLDIVIADSPMPPRIDVKAFNHLLGECGLTFFATPALAAQYAGEFPQRLDGAPLLLPGDDVAVRPKLIRWFDQNRLRPRIAGEFDDSALMAAFGQAGAGIFSAPSAIAAQIRAQYDVEEIGATDEITEAFYAISVERRLSHPAVIAISDAARQELFL
ncbi:MAG TPA: transcriptional activator NhaR [Methylophilaceae bacterium]|jgi:LysR family transcriptional activator of nhaA|nr:transcriptional activator NhaR [Methylophilaceae bacterium]